MRRENTPSTPDSQRTQSYHSAETNPSILTERCMARCITPLLDMDMEEVPFSVSFPEIVDAGNKVMDDTFPTVNPTISVSQADITEDDHDIEIIESITNMKQIEPQWSHDEIDEIVLISPLPKTANNAIKHEIRDIAEKTLDSKFTLLRVLINTNSSVAYLARNESNFKVYTLKRIKRNILFPSFCTESEALSSNLSFLNTKEGHRASFLPRLYGSQDCEEIIYLVTEYMPGGDIHSHIKHCGYLTEEACRFYASELVEAIAYLHAANIIHGDVSAENIIIASDGHIVLTGFDYAKSKSSNSDVTESWKLSNSKKGSKAPEVRLGWRYNSAVDCWGFGTALYTMMFGMDYCDNSGKEWPAAETNLICEALALPSLSMRANCEAAKDLLTKCLERNPALRIGISDIRSHTFFNTLDWTMVSAKVYTAPYIPEAHVLNELGTTFADAQSDSRNILHLKEEQKQVHSPSEILVSSPTSPIGSPTVIDSPKSAFSDIASTHAPLSPTVRIVEQKLSHCPSLSPTADLNERQRIFKQPSPSFPTTSSMLHGPLSSRPPAPENRTLPCYSSILRNPDEIVNRGRVNESSLARASMLSTYSLNSKLVGKRKKLRKNYRSTSSLTSKRTNALSTPNLPKGISQIGLGIGYTHVPAHSRSRISLASISPQSCYGKLTAKLRRKLEHEKNKQAPLDLTTSPSVTQRVYGSSWTLGHDAWTSTASIGAFSGGLHTQPTGHFGLASPSLWNSIDSPYCPDGLLSPLSV